TNISNRADKGCGNPAPPRGAKECATDDGLVAASEVWLFRAPPPTGKEREKDRTAVKQARRGWTHGANPPESNPLNCLVLQCDLQMVYLYHLGGITDGTGRWYSPMV